MEKSLKTVLKESGYIVFEYKDHYVIMTKAFNPYSDEIKVIAKIISIYDGLITKNIEIRINKK